MEAAEGEGNTLPSVFAGTKEIRMREVGIRDRNSHNCFRFFALYEGKKSSLKEKS